MIARIQSDSQSDTRSNAGSIDSRISAVVAESISVSVDAESGRRITCEQVIIEHVNSVDNMLFPGAWFYPGPGC